MPYSLLIPLSLFAVLVVILANTIATIIRLALMMIGIGGDPTTLPDTPSPPLFFRLATIIDDYVPDFTSLLAYAGAIVVLLTIAGAIFMSSRNRIVGGFKEIGAGNILYDQIRSLVPPPDWNHRVRIYYKADDSKLKLQAFNDLFTKKLLIGLSGAGLAFTTPSAFLFFYFHEMAHIRRGDTIFNNTFDSWGVVVFMSAILVNFPLVVVVVAVSSGEIEWQVRAALVAYLCVTIILFVYFYKRLCSMWRHQREHDADTFAFRRTGVAPRDIIQDDMDFDHPSRGNRLVALNAGRASLDAAPVLFFTVLFGLAAGLYHGITLGIVGLALMVITAGVYKGIWRITLTYVTIIVFYIAATLVATLAVVRWWVSWLGLSMPTGIEFHERSAPYYCLMVACVAIYGLCLLVRRSRNAIKREDGRDIS